MNGNSQPIKDDLTLIKGIGEARQKILNIELNVQTFSDLSRFEPSLLQYAFKARNEAVSLEMVEGWIERAAVIVAASSNTQALEDGDQLEIWQAYATFVVEFQKLQDDHRTNVHHMQGDDTYSWRGVEYKRLGQWITDKLVEVNSESRYGGVHESVDADVFAAIIGDFRIFAGELVAYGNQQPIVALDSQESLSIAVRIKIVPQLVSEQHIMLNIKCLAKHVETNEVRSVLVQEVVRIPFGAQEECIRLDAKALPVGRYHMLIAVGSESSCVRPHFSEIEEVSFIEYCKVE